MQCGNVHNSEIEGNINNRIITQKELKSFQKIADSDEDHRALLGAAWIHIQNQNYQKAVKAFNESLKRKKSANAYLGLGIAYEALHHVDYAISSYIQALNMKPNWTYAHYQLGRLYFNTGQKDHAMEKLDFLVRNNKALAGKLMDTFY
ncbi:MAG: tetratricopeptide repeat protein [Fibrobacteria bacterium]|nr:tetratricopeptide repeat protein [Fibrobacteria bacterium]